MKNLSMLRIFAILALTAIFIALPASAQATRTWVSGVGDDANPCSRTAPCKTFAGAISKTAAGGEISVLDPGGFGAVTITKSITISGDGTLAGILSAGTNGIIINAGASDRIVIRGISIDGAGTGLNGIRFLAGGSLHVERCTIANVTRKGISFEPSGASTLMISDTAIRNVNGAAGGGILVKPGALGSANVSLSNVNLERNLFGIRVEDRTKAVAVDTVAANNTNVGFVVFSNGGAVSMTLDHCMAVGNAVGIKPLGAMAELRIANCTVSGNAVGLDVESSGKLFSWGTNNVSGNTSDGVFPLPISLK